LKGCQLGIGRGVQKATKYPHQQLWVVELAEFVGHSFEFKLVFYLLENDVMLEKVIVDPWSYYLIVSGMEEGRQKRSNTSTRETDTAILDKVGIVIGSINGANQVDQVICALHSLAVLCFPVDSRTLSGQHKQKHVDKKYRDELLRAEVPCTHERSNWWQLFYGGAAFPTLARFLLYGKYFQLCADVACNWLACFPISARKHVYDVFFVHGHVIEVVQTLVPFLQQSGDRKVDSSPVCSNAERLVAVCLLENNGVLQIAKKIAVCQSDDLGTVQLRLATSRVAQLVTSIPDKARPGAPSSLLAHLFFKQITIQLLTGGEEWDRSLCDGAAVSKIIDVDGPLLFVGETLARICRRGSTDVLLSEVIPRILNHVRNLLSPETDMVVSESFESQAGFRFWFKMMEAIKDSYAVERLSEQLLHNLAAQNASDLEAYWVLWILFHQLFDHQTSIRSMFLEKFLVRKVFPICCLRWILQFAVLECPPHTGSPIHNNRGFLETVQRLVVIWSKREFVQSAPLEQQAYITAAVGLTLEKMSKEDLDATRDVMNSILQGVSCRLESPSHVVRKMASSIAFVFSKIIDPNNPLRLDDNCTEDNIDWEFGLATPKKGIDCTKVDNYEAEGCTGLEPEKEFNNTAESEMGSNVKGRKKKVSEFKLIDPDEVIDPVTLNDESVSVYGDDDASESSETTSDSSLQPYDLSDDDTDLRKKFSHLVDVVGALRKSDDADGVERALDVAEDLVRASPDELRFVAGDMARTLVQVRCSDSTVEGEEDSAEEKRQKALVALIVTRPVESVDTLNKLFNSPNLDVSQRIMILDVMTDAAQELANAKVKKPKHWSRAYISTVSDVQPWFVPSSTGPSGAGSWREIPGTGMPLNWSYSYERELPARPSMIKKGKSRRWSLRSANINENELELSQNKFPQYAAVFMLPAMQGFDKKRHAFDLLGRDFIVLGKLIYMLGVCMKCAAMHPEASALAIPVIDMLSSREICNHVEAYVRRSVLFAASCLLVALHPSYVASALVEGNAELSKGLEWVRTWALHVVESDSDRECYTMAMTCIQLHAEMALQASRALESTENTFQAKTVGLNSNISKGAIKIPYSSAIEF
ncbi:hypothetical protein RJ639_026915, partial [Escallonia herrerae]